MKKIRNTQDFKKHVAEIRATVFSEADEKENDAGYNGMHHDGGARKMREKYLMVENLIMRDQLPVEYSDIIDKIERESDPLYKKYLELKAQFEPE